MRNCAIARMRNCEIAKFLLLRAVTYSSCRPLLRFLNRAISHSRIRAILGFHTDSMQKLDARAIFAVRNRGILLDVTVFLVSLVLMQIIARLSLNLVRQAEEDVWAKLEIGMFFAGLFFLQPLGPILKRWSFHQRQKSFDLNERETAGCLLFWYMFFYIVMMILISGAAIILITEALAAKEWLMLDIGPAAIIGGFLFSLVSAVFIFRYFLKPKKKPHWKFLTSPRAELLGDTCMFLNVICLQILWNCLTASESFRACLISTPLGKPGSVTDILGRFIIVGVLALLVYLPARIFYLVETKYLKFTWLTMLLANMPLIVRVAFASRH